MNAEDLPADDVNALLVFEVIEGLVGPDRGRPYRWTIYRSENVKAVIVRLKAVGTGFSCQFCFGDDELSQARHVYDLIDLRFCDARDHLLDAVAKMGADRREAHLVEMAKGKA